MTLHLSIVADVFADEAQAKQAVEALRRAGFGYDQIGIAMQGHEGIDLLSDLEYLGVPHEQASYYAQAVTAGYTVVSVRPDGREQEVHQIMQMGGALTGTSTPASQTSHMDRQRVAGEQGTAPYYGSPVEQKASNTDDDFHQPRALKPRAEGSPVVAASVQTKEGSPHHDIIVSPNQMKASVEAPEDVTEQQPIGPPAVLQEMIPEPPLLLEEEHRETTGNADEGSLRDSNIREQGSSDRLAPLLSLKKRTNWNKGKTAVLAGGVLLAVGSSVLLVFLGKDQIRSFVLSIRSIAQKQRTTFSRRDRS